MRNARDTELLCRRVVLGIIGIEIGPDELVVKRFHGRAWVDVVLVRLAGWAPDCGEDDDERFTCLLGFLERCGVVRFEFRAVFGEFFGGCDSEGGCDHGDRGADSDEGFFFHRESVRFQE